MLILLWLTFDICEDFFIPSEIYIFNLFLLIAHYLQSYNVPLQLQVELMRLRSAVLKSKMLR